MVSEQHWYLRVVAVTNGGVRNEGHCLVRVELCTSGLQVSLQGVQTGAYIPLTRGEGHEERKTTHIVICKLYSRRSPILHRSKDCLA